jgi:UPF0271 protein
LFVATRPFLNMDLGELPEEPEELYRLAHAANIACGGHAGDVATMSRALDRCKRYGTRAGAHPSYPDLEGFGRRVIEMDPGELAASIEAQCEALLRLAVARGLQVRHAKAHGALYHAAQRDPAIARAFVRGVAVSLGPVSIFGPPSGALLDAARAAGLAYLREGFADRGYRPDGSLVPRGEPGALLSDEARVRAQVRQLVERGAFDTLCVHGDGPHALAFARAAREELDA